jgi:hypothetical protein
MRKGRNENPKGKIFDTDFKGMVNSSAVTSNTVAWSSVVAHGKLTEGREQCRSEFLNHPRLLRLVSLAHPRIAIPSRWKLLQPQSSNRRVADVW